MPAFLCTSRFRNALLALALGFTFEGASQAAVPTVAKPTPTVVPTVGPVSVAKPPLSLDAARAHQLRPTSAIGNQALEHVTGSLVARRPFVKFDKPPKLNANKLADALHAALSGTTRGYAMQLRKNGVPQVELMWDWSRTPTDGSTGWSIDTRMHVASVSKLMTAIIMVDLLDEKGISVDAAIGPYLPKYWTVGTNVAAITFRDLLTHRTGFVVDDSDGSFPVMKKKVAGNVAADAAKNYENVNFSLCRVVGAVLAGWVSRDTVWPVMNDVMWDAATTQWFLQRAQQKIFTPAGVMGVKTTASGPSAFAYANKTDNDGWDSGDLATQLGGAGFRLSVSDVLAVMGKYRRGGYVVTNTAGTAIEDMLGLDWSIDTPAGKGYTKNGAWGDDREASAVNWEQSVAYFLPHGIELVVLVNSDIAGGKALTDTVTNVILNSYE